MQVPAAGLHCQILSCTDRVGHRCPLQRSADVEAPEFFECLVVVSHNPAILQRRKQDAAAGVGRPGSNLNVRYSFRDDFMVDGVERGDGAVIKVAVVGSLLAVLLIPFFGFTELRRVFGEGKLEQLFFTSRQPAASSS